MKKYIIVSVIIAAILSYFFFDLGRYLTLEEIQAAQTQLGSWKNGAPLLTSFLFFALYIAVTALSLPGAAVLTLVAGVLFGLVWGVVLVSFASSLGATLAFLVARFILRDSIQKRFGDRL